MTIDEAKSEIGNTVDNFCDTVCTVYCKNEWYCPTFCDVLLKARKIDYSRILKCYSRHDGDIQKVMTYIKNTKINRVKGGY